MKPYCPHCNSSHHREIGCRSDRLMLLATLLAFVATLAMAIGLAGRWVGVL